MYLEDLEYNNSDGYVDSNSDSETDDFDDEFFWILLVDNKLSAGKILDKPEQVAN